MGTMGTILAREMGASQIRGLVPAGLKVTVQLSDKSLSFPWRRPGGGSPLWSPVTLGSKGVQTP